MRSLKGSYKDPLKILTRSSKGSFKILKVWLKILQGLQGSLKDPLKNLNKILKRILQDPQGLTDNLQTILQRSL